MKSSPAWWQWWWWAAWCRSPYLVTSSHWIGFNDDDITKLGGTTQIIPSLLIPLSPQPGSLVRLIGW